MTRLPIALFNYADGGQTTPGSYSFAGLRQAFAGSKTAPWLIMLCEAKEYGSWGSQPLLLAADALSGQLGRPYAGLLGWIDRGDFGPAIFYDPTQLALLYWGDTHHTVPDDKRNMAHFRIRQSGQEFLAIVQHWNYRSGQQRRAEAEIVDGYGQHRLPVILGGDLNSTASGLHLPQREWAKVPYRERCQKGQQLADGSWAADTAAVDHLIGRWDEASQTRIEGCGLQALAELAHQSGTPVAESFRRTVNAGSELLVDWLLVNRRFQLVPETYQVHRPRWPHPPSDHRLVTATIQPTAA